MAMLGNPTYGERACFGNTRCTPISPDSPAPPGWPGRSRPKSYSVTEPLTSAVVFQ